MISFETTGSFNKTQQFFDKMLKSDFYSTLDKFAQEGVAALASVTPVDSGETANSWSYEINKFRGGAEIYWTNSNVVAGSPVVILLQYGHGTGTGGYVQGRDFINPALKPVFDKIANGVWKAVQSA